MNPITYVTERPCSCKYYVEHVNLLVFDENINKNKVANFNADIKCSTNINLLIGQL